MPDQQIICPHCNTSISLTDTLTAHLKEQVQAELQQQNQKQLELVAKQQAELKLKEQQLLEAQKLQAQTLQSEKEKIWAIAKKEAQKKAIEEQSAKLKELEEDNAKKTAELRKAEQQELELRKKAREIEEREAKLELETQRKLDEERGKIAEESRKKSDEENRMKILEREKQIDMMRQTIEDLKRKSEQGSMQIQGEVQEDDLKLVLQTNCPTDSVEDVEKGIKGADLVQVVRNNFGQQAGVILWESKNQKSWKDEWVRKLKDDQNRVKADVCVIVSQVLPKGVETFALIENVWVVHPTVVLMLVIALRSQLIQLSQLKQSLVGREEKMELLYTYLSGPQFRNRVEQIVNAFKSMREGLDAEKRAFERIWKKREQEIERVMTNTAGMYGDLQGMLGASLPTVQSLELPSELEELEQGGLF